MTSALRAYSVSRAARRRPASARSLKGIDPALTRRLWVGVHVGAGIGSQHAESQREEGGAQDEPERTKDAHTAQKTDEHHEPVHAGPAAEERGAQDVVDGADDADAESHEQEPAYPVAPRHQPDGGGQPDDPRAERQQAEEAHHDTPEDWSAEAEHREGETSEKALHARDDRRRRDAGRDHVRRLINQAFAQILVERQRAPDSLHHEIAIAEHEKRRKERRAEVEEEQGDV